MWIQNTKLIFMHKKSVSGEGAPEADDCGREERETVQQGAFCRKTEIRISI